MPRSIAQKSGGRNHQRRLRVRRLHQVFWIALCVFKCCFRYIGVRAADGTLEHQVDAMARSKLVFRWSVRRVGGESLYECEVRCDSALERGVPHPEMSYCTKAELECIAMSAASSHEATLRQQDGQNNVGVVCTCAPDTIERHNVLRVLGVHVCWYVGVKNNDGEIDPGACAKKTAQLIFPWAIRWADCEETCDVSVRCDHAKTQGVPLPRLPYCTTADLEQLGNTAAAKHQASLHKTKKRTDIYVQCRHRILR